MKSSIFFGFALILACLTFTMAMKGISLKCFNKKEIANRPINLLDFCKLPVEKTNCDADIPLWYFDYPTRTCKTFYWGGCESNDNKFVSIFDCEEHCLGKKNGSH